MNDSETAVGHWGQVKRMDLFLQLMLALALAMLLASVVGGATVAAAGSPGMALFMLIPGSLAAGLAFVIITGGWRYL